MQSALAVELEYRLSKDIIPQLYDIHIKPYLLREDGPKQFTFEGHVYITVHATVNNVSVITLHKDRINILDACLYDAQGDTVQVIKQESMKYENITDKLSLHLSSPLKAFRAYILYFKYDGEIRNGMAGFYRGTYDNDNWYGMTQLHRIDARTAFPCFDEPEFKAKFQMHISRPRQHKAYFNTRLIKTTDDGIERVIDHFEESPLMSTYLVAFVISDFESHGNEDLRIIMQSQFKNKTNYAFEVALKALKAYDNYTAMPYKTMGNTLMQNVGLNHFPHSGMENWGLIIYKDSALALEPGYTDGWLNKQTTVSLVVHEIGHMWFGNSVTHKWWSYFWLNEAFPNYYQYFLGQELYPEYEFDKQFLINEMHKVFDIDASYLAQPMSSVESSINTPAEIGSKFSDFAYAKGASIVRMFANLMGKENFDLAIRDYLKENHLKAVEPENLFKFLKKYWPNDHNIDLDEFFKDWTEQVGYPMVMVSVTSSGRFSVKQNRFLLDPNDGSNGSLRYTIPITLNNDVMNDFNDLKPKFYLTKDQEERQFGNARHHKWLLVNAQQSNYYRVFYGSDLLKEIRQVLMEFNHTDIPVNNRANLVDDLFTYGRIGLKDYTEVLSFMEYLATETEYSPWQAAFKGLDNISKHLTLAQQDKFKDYLYDIMAKVYQELGFENSKLSILDIYNSNQVINWLCKYHHEDCNCKAQKLFLTYLNSYTKPLPDFRETLYCTANRNDKSGVYENLKEMFTQQQLLSEKEKLLKAMGCSRYRVKQHYEFLLSENIAKEMKIVGMNSLYSQTAENIVPVFHLMIANVEQLAESLESWSTTAKVISDIADYLTTQEDLSMLKEFIKVKGHLFGTSIRLLENAIQTAENNLKWSSVHIDKLMNYLQQRYNNITYRLEKDVVPEHYDIYLKPYLQQEDGSNQFTFDGEVNITLKAVKENIRKITLHKDYIEILQVILYDSAGNKVENIHSGSWLYEAITDKLTLYLMNDLEKETKYVLYLKYQSQIRNGVKGIFRATYDNVNSAVSEYELDKQFVINQVQLIFGTDATNNTQPLTSAEEVINSPSEIAYKFSGITYAKGAAIVRMFANLMGKENFDAAIREYLKDNWQLITLFYPNNARMALPCFDEPHYKAKFHLSIIRPPQYKSFFNTQLIKTRPISTDYEMDTFEVTPLMSTYLLAFMVSTYMPYGVGNLKLLTPRAQINSNQFAYETAVSALKICESHFPKVSQELGIPVVQMVGIQNYKFTAMESWGLIVLRHNILHHLPNYTNSWHEKKRTIGTIIHELVHMWFGNSVTPKWWNNFWLNEAFARYYEVVLGQKFNSSYEFLQEFIVDKMHTVMEIDASPATQAMSRREEDIKRPQDMNSITNAISYDKGASVLHMFSKAMGQDKFDLAVRDYLQENHLKNTVPEDLFKHLHNHWPSEQQVNLKHFFNDWIKQKGYPLITLTTTANNKYLLKQQHFLIDKHQLKKSKLSYTIPISYTNDKELDFESLTPKFYFNKTFNQMTFGNVTANKWLILNIQQSGYYRVFYDSQLLHGILEAFMEKNHSAIPAIQRAAIINDLFSYAKIGLINYNQTFNFIKYLASEKEYLPLKTALKAIQQHIASRLSLKKQERLAHIVNQLLEHVYSTLQFETPNDSIFDVLKRNLITSWLCKYKHEDCNNRMQHMFQHYKEKPTEISCDFRETLYCNACRFGDKEIYDYLKQMFLSQKLESEKFKILKAMSCTRFHVKSHYEFVLSRKVATNFKVTALMGLFTETLENVDLVFELLTENVEKLSKSLKSWRDAAKVLSEIANYFTTKEQLNAFKKFINGKGHLFESAVDILHDSVETVEDNLKWSRMHLKDLFSEIEEESNEAPSVKGNINIFSMIVCIIIYFY